MRMSVVLSCIVVASTVTEISSRDIPVRPPPPKYLLVKIDDRDGTSEELKPVHEKAGRPLGGAPSNRKIRGNKFIIIPKICYKL